MLRSPETCNSQKPFLRRGLRGRGNGCFLEICNQRRMQPPSRMKHQSKKEKVKKLPWPVSSPALTSVSQWPKPPGHQSPKESTSCARCGLPRRHREGWYWTWQSTQRINSSRVVALYPIRVLAPADAMSDSRLSDWRIWRGFPHYYRNDYNVQALRPIKKQKFKSHLAQR